MDFFVILLVSIIAFVGGVACTLLIEFYIFERYLKSGPIAAPPPKKPIPHGKAQLPDELLTKIKQEKSGFSSHGSSGDENLAINLALQFLFNELRNSERVRLWLFKKLNNEFKEFVDQTITGKLFESVRLRDIHLGKNFPMIKGMEVADAKICADTGLLETLDLALDLHYSGNFQLSIDVELLSKTAFLALQVKRVTGKARLQFTRVPYTHWSLSFYSEPILELEVQSQFHGRQLQSQVINIIVNQIRKAVRRKHTLPHYKMRYKPFFRRLNDEDVDLSEVASTQLTPGTLDVTLIELSRLNVDLNGGTKDKSQIEIYCTMSIDYTPWVYITQYGGIPYMVLDLIISKTSSQNFGVVFKREFVLEISQHCVIVETIVAGSPAAAAEMKRGDIIVAVNGKKVTGLTQVAKLIKSATQRRFIVRVERKYSKIDSERSSFKQDLDRISDRDFDRKSSRSDVTIFSKESDSTDSGNVSMERSRFEGIKFSDLKEPELDLAPEKESGYKLFRRKSSARTTEDLAHSPDNTPTRKISTSSSLSNTSTGIFYNMDESMNTVAELFTITSEKSLAAVITFDETKSFKVESEHQYLNVGVWAKSSDQPPRLVGYINAPIKLILAQCSTTSTGNYLKCQSLLPPDTVSTSNASKLHGYSGFDPTLCYGDILLSYTWSSSNLVQPIVDNSNNASNNAKKGSEDAIKVQPILLGVESNDKKLHDFMRTHFHRATQCDFCSKKIWLKDAVQCRDCGMVCHKKCENRCQMLNYCSADSLTTLACEADEVETLVTGDSGPEISLTSCEENVQGASMMAVKASIANTLLGLKKAGSTSCLAPPNAGMGLASRSLPPSPCASRKSSLVGGLGISNELLEGADPSLVAPLLAGELSDGLMSKAKDTGKYLFNHLEKEERLEKINSMIMKLNSALDTETTSRLELSQNGDNGKLITQSDLRVQTMSILLLHYCTGLQHAQKCSDGSPDNSQA